MQILKSATKVTLLLMVLGLLIFTFLGNVEWKDFIMLASMVLAFYFGKNPTNNEQI